MKRAQGFTLLEAIVALVIFASVGMALFAWMNTNLNTVARIQSIQERDAAIRVGLEWIETINPMDRPSGTESFEALEISWESEAIRPRQDGTGPTGGESYYQIALYEVAVEVSRPGRSPVEFSVRRAGYEQVRFPQHFE